MRKYQRRPDIKYTLIVAFVLLIVTIACAVFSNSKKLLFTCYKGDDVVFKGVLIEDVTCHYGYRDVYGYCTLPPGTDCTVKEIK